jgi:hypothetical protein
VSVRSDVLGQAARAARDAHGTIVEAFRPSPICATRFAHFDDSFCVFVTFPRRAGCA